jgi:uncharacterized protein (DUF2147 family)
MVHHGRLWSGAFRPCISASKKITIDSATKNTGGDRKRDYMRKSIVILVMSIMAAAATAHAANGDGILGVWNNEEQDARIEVFKCSGKYCGKIVSLKEPNYPAGSKEGTPGTPRLDGNNTDRANRSRPIIDLQIVNDFVFFGEGVWKDGSVYDPKNGKTYRGKITLVSPDKLELRGFIGIPLFGRTTTWTR